MQSLEYEVKKLRSVIESGETIKSGLVEETKEMKDQALESMNLVNLNDPSFEANKR